MRSEASIATSVPVPIASPRSACASAGASLTPSPTIATTRPSACSSRTTSALSAGSTSAITSSMPTSRRHGVRGRAVVAGQQHGPQPERAAARATASAEVGLTVSATTISSARVAPSQPTATAVRPAAAAVARAASSSAPSGPTSAGGRRGRGGPRRRPRRRALVVGEVVHRRERAELVARGARDRPRDRVLGGVLERAGQPQHLGVAARTVDVHERHPAGGDRAGLVEHDRVDAAGGLEHLGALDQEPELCAAAGADQQRGRRGEPERARAGDDQDGDGGGEGERGVLAAPSQHAERGDARGRSRRARTRRRCGRRAAGRAPCRSAPRSTRRPIWASAVSAPTRVARTTSRPPAFTVAAGDRRRRAASRPARTRRSAATGRRAERRPRRRRRSRPSRPAARRSGRRPRARSTGTRRSPPSGSRIPTSLAPSSSSARQRRAGAALGARLEVAAGEQEDGDRGRDLEVDLARPVAPAMHARTATSRTRRVTPSETSVSIVAGACRGSPSAARWNGSAPQVTIGRRAISDDPLPGSNCSAGTIASRTTGTASSGDSAASRAARSRPGFGVGRRERRPVARRLDRRDQLLAPDAPAS